MGRAMSAVPPFVHPITLPGEFVEGGIAEALGVDEAELRAMHDELQRRFDEIAEAQAAAMRRAHEVVIWQ